MHWWYLGAVANAVIVAAYVAISAAIIRAVVRSRRSHRNPLALALAAVFLTAGVHHGLLFATRHALDAWETSAWDVAVAAAAVWCWALRSRFPALVRGAAAFEDLKRRQKHALEIHDDLVQTLAAAKLSLELEKPEEGLDAVERMLHASRRTMTDLLGDQESEIELGPGDLRRETAPGGA